MKIPFTASYLFYAFTWLLLSFGGGGLFQGAMYDIAKDAPQQIDSGLFIFSKTAYRFTIWKSVPGYAVLEKSFLELKWIYVACFALGIFCLVVYKCTRFYIEKKEKKKK